jgi:hypothetical protein
MKTKALFFVLLAILICGSTAFSIPLLQVYIEGAVYDTQTETWVYSPAGSSGAGEANIRLWAIGNIGGPGSKGSILDVKLSLAYDSTIAPIFTITPSQIYSNDYPEWSDPSKPDVPAWIQTNSTGASPIMGDGKSLPSHGIYGAGVTWQEFALGNMTLKDSPVGDFIYSFPTPVPNKGQINVYDISITNVQHGDYIHFDLYDHIVAANHSSFAPFSHDADGQTNIVPEPSALLLLGSGICALAFYTRRRRQ